VSKATDSVLRPVDPWSNTSEIVHAGASRPPAGDRGRAPRTENVPYVVASYGPLYYGLIAVGVRLFGDQFVFGRALGLVSLIISAVCIYLILRRYIARGSRFIPVLGAGLLLAQYPVQAIAGIQGPDMVGLALALSGLALVFLGGRATDRRQIVRVVLAGCLLAAAVVVRQPLFLPILVAFSWYALHRDRRAMMAFSLTVVCIGAGAFAFLQATSGGGFLWHAVRLQGAVAFSLTGARGLAELYLRSPATIFTLVLLAIGMLRSRTRDRQATNGDAASEMRLLRNLLLVYLVVAAILAFVTSSKAGASINYWLEVSAVLSMLTPLYLGGSLDLRATPDFRRRKQLWSSDWVYLVLVIATFGSALVTGAREAHGQVLQWRALPYVNEVVDDIHEMSAPGELVYVEYPDPAVSAGRPYVFNDLALYEDSSLLSGLYRRVLRSNSFRLIVSLAQTAPPGYAPVCLTHAAPAGVYDVRIYYRTSIQRTPRQKCIPA
jgi:hypothetical protein